MGSAESQEVMNTMSTFAETPGDRAQGRSRVEARPAEYDESPGYGWVMFAGTMLLMAGTLSIIYGIAAVAKSSFYVANTHFVFSSLNTWGWIVLVIGAIAVCAGIGVYAQAAWAQWTGVAVASLNAIAQLLFIAAYPWLSLAIFAIDVLVIYGLIAYGGRPQEA
jgi:hypothetical protein